jgi:hypothetical protein
MVEAPCFELPLLLLTKERDVTAELVIELRDLRLAVGRVDPRDLGRAVVLELTGQLGEGLSAGLGGQTGHGRGGESRGGDDNAG